MRGWSTLALLAALAAPAQGAETIWTFESVPSRPLALSSDKTRLYAVNTPDAELEIFDVTGATPVRITSVPVGLEPVAVALRSDGEVWVVNQLSDSVSVVDVAADPPRVVRTLLVGDEPQDIVFASGRAFVTTAHRGQNTADPTGQYSTPGIGRADVYVFDPADVGNALLPEALTVLHLFADKPRALAVSPDGQIVYAAAFLSGNRTTSLSEGAVRGLGTPPPGEDHAGAGAPSTGLIVGFDGAKWTDELGRDWSSTVKLSLPDEDVFTIDAASATVTSQVSGVGTVLFAMAVNPQNGHLYVSNTEAKNRTRFEGPGTYVTENHIKPEGEPASVRGHLHEARVTVVDGSSVIARHLNPHLDYSAHPQPADAKDKSLAQPLGMAVSADGETLYLTAFGSGVLAVLPTAQLENGSYVPKTSDHVTLTGGGPTGVVLDEDKERAYVATRFDDGISVVGLASKSETAHVRMHTPESAEVYWGRPLLYDAHASSSTGEASCGSCHIFGDFDGLAWDLGNPDGDVVANTNPLGPAGTGQPFHPMKGPMTTQTLRGMSTHGPMHWRGDRTGGGAKALDEHAAFVAFNVAFDSLLGRDEGPIADADMSLFADFILRVTQPPNPIRNLDSSRTADQQAGMDTFFNHQGVDAISTCQGCHQTDAASGFFGTGGLTTFENEPQEMKVPELRNLYQKVGMFGMAQTSFISGGDNDFKGPQVRGFGFLHDGSVDTTFRFVHASVFPTLTETDRHQLEAFLMAFDSDLAPVVGQSVTVDASSGADVVARAQLLAARAQTAFTLHGATGVKECDLVAHTVIAGEARGLLLLPDGKFTSDRAAEPERTLADLQAIVAGGSPITFLCAPPGQGVQMALDRDGDGVRDRDELDEGHSPIDRPIPIRPGTPTQPDAGVASSPDAPVTTSPDAGTSGPDARIAAPDARVTTPDAPTVKTDDGGCSVGGGSSGGLAWLFVLGLLWRRRRS